MLKLRVVQPGTSEQTFAFDRNWAVIGRKKESGVDLVIPQPFISARHAVVLKGLVVYDLGSSNGTFVSGQRIRDQEPTLVRDNSFTVGREEVRVFVERDSDSGEDTVPSHAFRAVDVGSVQDTIGAGSPLDFTRYEKRVGDVLRENADLKRRIAGLEAQIGGRSEANAEARARGAVERLFEMQKRTAELEERVRELEAQKRRPEDGGATRP